MVDHQANIDVLTNIDAARAGVKEAGRSYPSVRNETEIMLTHSVGAKVIDTVTGLEVEVIGGTRKSLNVVSAP